MLFYIGMTTVLQTGPTSSFRKKVVSIIVLTFSGGGRKNQEETNSVSSLFPQPGQV